MTAACHPEASRPKDPLIKCMLIGADKLMRLPVYTESGIRLGRVSDLEIDADTHNVLRYVVRPNFLIPKTFLVATSQVKDITDKKVIVYDSTLKSGAEKAAVSSEE